MFTTQSSTLSLRPGHVLPLTAPGRLDVVAGRVWLTRADDLDDHWLDAGESIAVDAGHGTVVEAWGGTARLAWSPVGAVGRLTAWLRGLAARVLPHNPPHDRPRSLACQARRGAAGAA